MTIGCLLLVACILIILLVLRRRALIICCMRIIRDSAARQSGYSQALLIQVFGAFEFGHGTTPISKNRYVLKVPCIEGE